MRVIGMWKKTHRAIPAGLRKSIVIALAVFSWASTAAAQAPSPTPKIGENCTVSIQNRTVQVNADGTFAIPNVPAEQGYYRVRVVCRQPDGTTVGGQSDRMTLVPNGVTDIPGLKMGRVDPIPVSLQIEAFKIDLTKNMTQLTTKGETTQLTVIGTLPDGSTADFTAGEDGTTYTTSNPRIATVSANGLVTAVSRGQAIISARNEGTLSSIIINVLVPNDADDDGLTDEFERANSLNPFDGTDAGQDADGDGLSNLQEFQGGTNPRAADTDGDGLSDSGELSRGTNPRAADTDGDGLTDGQEVAVRTNPLQRDTDGDGIPDGLEMRLGLNPLVGDVTTSVQGRVVNAQGAAVAGTSAIVFNLLTATTDSTGFFNIPQVPSTLGPITVLAQTIQNGQVLAGTSAPVPPSAGGTTDVGTIQIGLDSGTVSGTILDLQNRPVSGAQVTIRSGPDVRPATTDVTGRYRVTNMVSGPVEVTARDFSTGLRGRSTGTLLPNQSASIDVRLAPSGRVAGTVFNRDGATPAGAGVTVNLSGAAAQSARTDVIGQFSLDFVPLGSFTVEATDTTGNRGRTTGSLTATSQVAVADVAFLGRGIVNGVVRDGAGNPVPNATINLNSRSIFGGSRSASTDAAGQYSFADVFVGEFDVAGRAPITRLGGQSSGRVDRDGQTVTSNITLVASGTLAGTVFRSNGTTPVAGAEVRLSPTGLAATTDAQGRYRFELVPVGSYTFAVNDVATGDRGRASATLSAQDETRIVNINLNGQGQLTVTVNDGAGNASAGAQVTVTSRTQFGGSLTGTTQADGRVTFARVLAGGVDITAFDPNTQLRGSGTATVGVGTSASATVNLQSYGSVRGTVIASDGATPVGNIRVRLVGQVTRTMVSGSDGAYRFDIVPVGEYSLEAIDSAGNVRARGTARIGLQGEEAAVNLTLVGAGTVTGTVTSPEGNPVRGISVTLQSAVDGFRTFSTSTDVSGVYTINNVPVGGFTVNARQRTGEQELFGTAQGFVVSDGERVTKDVELSVNLVPVTRTLYDANNLAYNLRENGSLQDGTANVFAGDSAQNRGASLLDIVAGGVPLRFGGQSFGTSEQEGREIAIQQQGLGGLNVTRKTFVPRAGYFARHLEILQNPTASPITVDVRLTTNYRFIRKVQNGFTFDREPRLVSTSSGDTALDVADPATRDRWAVVDDDEDVDPFLATNLPPVAQVFDGAGAAREVGQAQFSTDFTNQYGQLVYEWKSVEVPAGGAVALMHFVAEQTGRGAARASAERLAGLPPEAVAGLSSDEISQIKNFAVPAAGTSPSAPLPPLTGTVGGRVFGADNATPIAGAGVSYQSSHPLFGRTHNVTTNQSGEWSLAAKFNDSGSSIAVPVGGFVLRAIDPQTRLQSPLTPGDFPPDVLAATQNVVFSNSGIIEGVVRRASGVVASSGTIQLSGGDLSSPVTLNMAGDGSFRFTGVPAGTYTVAANLPHPQGTALGGTTTALSVEGQRGQADITIQPTGEVTGLVRRGSGETVVNLTVQLRRAGFLRTARTDTSGRFTFTDVPAGTFTLETFEQATNTAASVEITAAADQTLTRDLELVRGGTVTGLVTNPSNQAVAGAQVTMTASNGNFTGTTDATGHYRFEQVPAGNVSVVVVDPVSGLRGRAGGSIGLSGEVLTLNARLSASGTVVGTVLRSDGATPVAGAQVTLRENVFWGSVIGAATTDAAGRYSIDLVPVGSFVVEVSDPATGDRGRTTNQVNANGETRSINVILNGLGGVTVTVRDGSGNLVSGARVTLNSQTQFGGSQQGDTQGDGAVTFARVLAGNFSVSATDPATRLGGSAAGSVAANSSASVLVQLQPAGTVTGRVFGTDAVTPQGGATVRLHNNNYYFSVVQQGTSAGDGSYRFDAVPLGTYSVDVVDATGRVRAKANGITLSTNAEVVARDLTLVGQGNVSGRVLNPAGTAAPALNVTLRSANTEVGGFFTARTDDQGRYSVSSVPVGGFTVTSGNSAQGTQGETSGRVTADGQTLTADIQLVNNAINLPANRYDANNFFFNVQRDGSVRDGTNSVFAGNFSASYGAFFLELVVNGTTNRFAGGTIGHTEEGGREIAVRQQNIAGLDVTRKVYVPAEGYFARYVEVITNPTANPVTVGVAVRRHVRPYYSVPGIVATSSGDAALGVGDGSDPDRWVVLDDSRDDDPFLVSGVPAVGFAFDGAGAARRTGAASFTNPYEGTLTQSWDGVTIEPGATVAFMHFGVQQTSRAAAQASVQRLAQLPPEALAGLSADEITQIQNFAVPADGTSQLEPLPALNGTITGQVLASDETTAVPFGQVSFKSNNVLFGRTYRASSNASGAFSFTSRFNNSGSSIAIPVDGFNLSATHPVTGVPAPAVNGTFAAGQTAAAQNVVFSNTGLVRGVVRRHTGQPVTGGTVLINRFNPYIYNTVAIAGDGSYIITGVPAGAATLTARLSHPQGTPLSATANVTVAVGATTTADFTLPATGGVSGTVRTAAGAAAASVYVQLRNASSNFVRSLYTNSAGQFVFTDVLTGTLTLEAFEPATGVPTAAQVVVAQDQTTTQDLTLVGLGQGQVQVNFAGGSPASSSAVYWRPTDSYFRFAGYTDAAGRLTINSIPVGSFVVRAHHPNNGSLSAEVTGAVTANGEVVPVTVVLPGTGVVTGRVTNADDTPSANSYVEVFGPNVPYQAAYTDSNGNYSITQVPAGRPFSVLAYTPDFNFSREVTGNTIAADGDTLAVNVRLPAIATVRVRVLRSDGTPYGAVRINFRDSQRGYFYYAGNTGTDGILNIPQVPAGDFAVQAFDALTFAPAGTADGAVTAADHGRVVEVTVNAPRAGNVEGRVFAADAQTTLPYVFVELYDVAAGSRLTYTWADETGRYRFNGVAPGNDGFRVVAHSPSDFSVTGEATGQIANSGDTVTADLTLPVSVVKGTVYFADGTTRAVYPSVFVTQADAAGNTRTYYANSGDENGNYVVVGVGVGDFTVVAQDGNSGLTGTATGTLADIATPVTVDVTLPPSGTVTGTVRDAAGNAVPYADVALTASGLAYDQYTSADENGVYRFERVALGSFAVQATSDYDLFGLSSGAVSTDGQTVTVDITLPAGGTVRGTVFSADGATPLAGASVRVENFENGGPLGYHQSYVASDAAGNYEATNVQAGSVQVTAYDPADYNSVGLSQGTLAAPGPVTINVTVGSAVRLTYNLDGADGFRYDVDNYGSMNDGGTVDRTLTNAYNGAYYLTIPRSDVYGYDYFRSRTGVATLEDDGRELRIGPSSDSMGGLSVTRKVFVPAAGGFARFLDALTNPTDAPLTVTFQVESYFGNYRDIRLVVTPSETSNRFAVTDNRNGCCNPALAHVFGGTGASAPVTGTHISLGPEGYGELFYRWSVTVPARQTRILMHFTVQRGSSDAAGARVQAEALVNLTDAAALQGMSAQEKAQVINFAVPQN